MIVDVKFVDSFSVNGFEYFKVWENPKWVIMCQSRTNEFGQLKVFGYELIQKVLLEPVTLKGVEYPFRYKIPKNEDFGVIAWSYSSIQGILSNPPNAISSDTVLEISRHFEK